MSQPIESLIHAQWIIPVVPQGLVLERHCLAIQGGRILDILPSTQGRRKYQAEHELELSGQVLIPGLINAHTHAAMSLLRGLADDLPLMTWLNEHIWPAEGKWVSAEFVHDGSQLAIAEMLLGGTTCFNDMYFFPDVTARAADAAGIRATVGLIAIDFPSAWAADADGYLHKGLEVHDQFRSHRLIHTAFAPHAPYSVNDSLLERVRVFADELDIPIHIHLHESHDEILHGLREHGKRPMQRLQDLGLLSPSLQAVHMTHLEAAEIEQFALGGGHVLHCPESNLKLASGFCPVKALLTAGINVALGTDGAASNNDLDMFGEMRTAALLGKAVAEDASAIPAMTALKMATLNGAKALGLEAEIGSLSIGKYADIVAVDLSQLETQPLYCPISQLVYAAGREHVTDVWVAGKRLLKQRQLTTLDMQALASKTQEWQHRLDSL